MEGAVEDAVRRASNRHRRSVTMAVEVLEEANSDASRALREKDTLKETIFRRTTPF